MSCLFTACFCHTQVHQIKTVSGLRLKIKNDQVMDLTSEKANDQVLQKVLCNTADDFFPLVFRIQFKIFVIALGSDTCLH